MDEIADYVRAACRLGAGHGFDCADPVVLRDRSNLIIHLAPTPLVARIPWKIHDFREDILAGQYLELDISRYLSARGLPVIAPSELLGYQPHPILDRHATFWPYVARSGPADTATAIDALTAIHDALARYPGNLGGRGPITDVEFAVRRLAWTTGEREALMTRLNRSRMIIDSANRQPLHGDAHYGNVIGTPTGVLWTDFEDAWAGPLEWDYTCLRTGRHPIEATGDSTLMAACAELRSIQAALWSGALRPGHMPEDFS